MATWQMDFDYIESCNCAAACPCPFTGAPTQGHCDLVMGFHIVRGSYGPVPLEGQSAVMIVDVPGNMRAGGYRTGIYVEERGDAGPAGGGRGHIHRQGGRGVRGPSPRSPWSGSA